MSAPTLSVADNITELPLPYGWVKQLDANSKHPFWVDTKANPPRSIWTHPYEDEQFLSEHPDIREKVARKSFSGETAKPPVDEAPRRHSFDGGPCTSTSRAAAPMKKRGLFSRLKDKAIGTREEREARRIERELSRQQREQERQARLQQLRLQQQQQQLAWQQQQLALQQQPGYQQYAAPTGAYRPSRFGGGGGLGTGGALLGGLAGGFLLGEALGGFHHGGWGGDYGGDGGDFGGGDFGGGDFGGGF